MPLSTARLNSGSAVASRETSYGSWARLGSTPYKDGWTFDFDPVATTPSMRSNMASISSELPKDGTITGMTPAAVCTAARYCSAAACHVYRSKVLTSDVTATRGCDKFGSCTLEASGFAESYDRQPSAIAALSVLS